MISTQQKTLTSKYHCHIMATAEYRKTPLGDGKKMKLPVNDDLADARALIYRPNYIVHVYNDLHDRGSDSEIFWVDKAEPNKRQPRLMLIFAKNKITSFKSPEDKLMFDLNKNTVTLSSTDIESARGESISFAAQKESGNVIVDGDNIVYRGTEWSEE